MIQRERLIQCILGFFPLINEKIFKDIKYKNSLHQMRLIGMLEHNNGKPMKYFCEKLMIPKSNLTKVANRLIEEELIERKTDEKDRRIINLYITKKGKEELAKHKQVMKENIRIKLEKLSNEDIQRLISDFEEIELILNKL
ncbi:MarR family winged helix-turn-helix transcriptional regulator [Vallitalea sp.]|uniref:MarR family winged helix-turn-helix transcriptional regulator n=1 Tax=Vallitalea sp. TaxID=1882829 RepID=UPI0025EE62CB|nr:MarR family transcriptional regulator [Vallitalea sp.]MCT4688724.1 MarR family transcriptional regulator [Vallitalea sp.]